MSALTKALQIASHRPAEQADAVLEHVRTGETVELTFHGRAVALILTLGTGGDRGALDARLGARELRGHARYASEEDLFGTGETWVAER